MQRAASPGKFRYPYTWHLRPPFAEIFDSRPWWTQARGKVDPVAALYERARRHPRVGELRTKYQAAKWHGMELRPPLAGPTLRRIANLAFADIGDQPAAIHCLCLIGLRAWCSLDLKDQEYWEMSAGKLKGVDCRHRLKQCDTLVSDGLSQLFFERARRLKVPREALQFRVAVSCIPHSLRSTPSTPANGGTSA